MRLAFALFSGLILANCGTEGPPVASFPVKGDYRAVTVCLYSQLSATERRMIYADDTEHELAVLWEDFGPGDGPGGRKFDLVIRKSGPGEVVVEVRRAGLTRFDRDRFLARLQQALTGC
jgi:hypothetical protein